MVTFQVLGIRTSHMNLWGGHNSSHNTITSKRGEYEMANAQGILKKEGLENFHINQRYKKGQVEKIV